MTEKEGIVKMIVEVANDLGRVPKLEEAVKYWKGEVEKRESRLKALAELDKLLLPILGEGPCGFLGHTVLCTYEDLGADSAANNSIFSVFVLHGDGRVTWVGSLGLYASYGEPTLRRAVAQRLPLIEAGEIGEKAPQCLEAAKAASARPREVK